MVVHIADRSLSLGNPFHNDSLVFWYDPEDGLSTIPTRFYSGLTQAWYIRSIGRLSEVRPEFTAYLPGLFRSLKVDVDDRGCLLRRDFGWAVEEYPYAPPLFVLNG